MSTTTAWADVESEALTVEATIPELMEIADDVVDMVGGRVQSLTLGFGTIAVHVFTQADAEFLARRLWLGQVDEYGPEGSTPGFAVWSGGEQPVPLFKVFYVGEMVRPVRAFPLSSVSAADGVDTIGSEAA